MKPEISPKPKVRIYTLGCKVNQYDSEVIMSAMKEAGFERAEEGEPAGIIIINSCTVTASGDQKMRQTLHRAKKDNPSAVTVLTGCMPQAFPKEAGGFAEADIVTGTKNRAALPGLISEYLATGRRMVSISPHENGEPFEAMSISSFSGRTRAFVKIEDGCNRFCSYCIIPYARGRVRSKPLSNLLSEIEALAASGYREIVLTGINLSAYGQDFGLHLCDAVEAACMVNGIDRVRLGSLEPEQLSEADIFRLSRLSKLCPQFHLSLQSGCDTTLRHMNRHYSCKEYMDIVNRLRKSFKNAAVTTDVMVGFPGETDDDFEASLEFVRSVGFAKAHVFAYSRRPGTAAATLPAQIPNRVKEERSRRMIAAALESQSDFFKAQSGLVEDVLFEQLKPSGFYEGHTANYTPVLAASAKDIRGQLLPVKITSAQDDHCLGELLSASGL